MLCLLLASSTIGWLLRREPFSTGQVIGLFLGPPLGLGLYVLYTRVGNNTDERV